MNLTSMEPRSLEYIAAACAGERIGGSPEILVRRVCTDSRLVQRGDLFVALTGDRFDGHEFLADVARHEAAGALVNRGRLPAGAAALPLIAVENTRRSLGQIAARYRQEFGKPLIAVGGSNGKTTTKDLIAAVLRQRGPALASESSFNNDIGVPLTLLKMEQSNWAGVLEVGTNHPGELAPLVRMIEPRYGVITSIGREHLEFFGDISGVVEEEGWLAELLPAEGILLINGDSPHASEIASRTQARVARVGSSEPNDWRVRAVRMDRDGLTFDLAAPVAGYSGEYRLQLLGSHQAVNAAFAIALGCELGLEPDGIRRGLASCPPAKMRLQLWSAGGVQVLDDGYNANADSMKAALETLRALPTAGRRVAVLGEMAELGAHTAEALDEVGRCAAQMNVDMLFTVGRTGVMARAAREGGVRTITEFATAEAAIPAIREFVRPGDLVLLKASRAAGFERIAAALREQP